ncbi:hypothetical protein PENTCL1PPCAC_16352, partial [Pristionchus entomophagus]
SLRMAPICIPRKFSSSTLDRDPNKNHVTRCVVVMVDALDDEEAFETVQSRFAELSKYTLRLPSDVCRYEELAEFFSLEDTTRKERGCQTDRRITGRGVACQTDVIVADEIPMANEQQDNEMEQNTV